MKPRQCGESVVRFPRRKRRFLFAFSLAIGACSSGTEQNPRGAGALPSFPTESTPPEAQAAGGSAQVSPSPGEGPSVSTLEPSTDLRGSAQPVALADAGDPGSAADAAPVEACTIIPNTGSVTDGDVNIDLTVEFQRIAGFGGMDGGFYAELSASQVDTAFGNAPGQRVASDGAVSLSNGRASVTLDGQSVTTFVSR
jgi:hypothetical protein